MAADAAVGLLLENLSQLIRREAEQLISVQDDIEWIQTEFRLMVAKLESVVAQHHLSREEETWVGRTRTVIRKAEDTIQTYVRRKPHIPIHIIPPVTLPIYTKLHEYFYRIKETGLRKELLRIRDEIKQVRQGWRSVDFAKSLRSRQDRELGSSSQDSGFAAMAKLDSAMQEAQYWVRLLDGIKWVRDELEPLHDFLQKIDHEQGIQVLGERQKIWIQELRDIFQFIDKSFACSFQGSREWLFSCFISYSDQLKLCEVVSQIQSKILQLYRRYYAYGFGEILVNNGSRSIFPRIRMTTPIPDVSTQDIDSFAVYTLMCLVSFFHVPATQRQMRVTCSSWLTPGEGIDLLRADLKLMKALFEDTRSMGELDERVKVWLNQMQEISVDLVALDEQARTISQERKGVFHQISDRMKMARKLRHIRYQIRDIAARKMTYGISSALGEAGLMLGSIAANSFEDQPYTQLVNYSVNHSIPEKIVAILEEPVISKAELRRHVKPVRKEMELMQALLQDANRMEKLDARLKFWVEKMQGIAREANAAVQLESKSLIERMQCARGIKKIQHHIFIMSKWKHTYDIGDVKSRSRAGIFSYNQEETGPHQYDAIWPGSALIKSERELVGALLKDILQINEPEQIISPGFSLQNLDRDIGKIDELDGISKAWVEEMINVFKIDDITHDRLKDKVRQLSEIRIAYGIEIRQRLPPSIVHEIKEKLLTDHEHRFIVPIFGMKDAHKESLQELINDDYAIRHHFHWHAWVKVPEEFRATSLSEDIAYQIVEQNKAQFLHEEVSLEGPKDKKLTPFLQDLLKDKRFLIVLDEIQTVEVWQQLEPDFQHILSGSRIILMRKEQTCSSLSSTSDAIHVVPGSDASNMVNQSVPSYLRQCIYYFLLFPANFEVPARRLIVLWVAEGLVHSQNNGNDSLEHVAYRYLKDLIARGLVHVTQEKPNGDVKACKLDDGRRETWLKMAKEARFFQDANGIISRLVDHHGASDSCFIHINGRKPNSSTSAPNYKNVISFLSFNTQEGSKPGEGIGDFLRKCISSGYFRLIRVLDLERVFRPKLPKALSKLTLLRYLGLRWTYLENLPKYVSKFLNLHVLDVKHTYISILPKSIWKMRYLRHLYLSETYRTRFYGRPSDISLNDLQTLWGAFIDEKTLVKEGLDTLVNIRKLGLSCRSGSSEYSELMKEQLEAVDKWISKLEFLESLRLKSRDEHGKPTNLHLSSLKKNENLSTVYLLGRLQQSVVYEFPVNLIDITLSGSELAIDPMISLGKLPKLVILRLLSQSVVDSTMTCHDDSFPQLKVLKIWKLQNLKKWEAEEGSLPSLEELEIRSCKNLEMLPDRLQHVENLQIMLTKMPKGFIDETEVKQPALWAKVKKFTPALD